MDKSVWKKTYSSFPGVKQASTIDCELLQIFRVSKYDCVVGTIYTSTRAREHNGVCGMCAVPCREPLACYVKHSEQLPRVRCAAMCARVEGQCARAGTAECRVAPFRGCGPKKQSISLLPTGRRSFSFIDSCPPILVPCPVFLSIFYFFILFQV